jgi:hypothetical protein
MTRIVTIKRVGFPPEECPVCYGDEADTCSHCDEYGVFRQLIRSDWSPPVLNPGESLVAYLDVDHWTLCIEKEDGDIVEEVDFPFATEFATASHFRTLGFVIEQ